MNENTTPSKRRSWQFSIKAVLIIMLCATTVALPVCGFCYLVHRRDAWRAEVERREQQDARTVKQVAVDVEAVCNELGRAPEDQVELESLLGKPLPNVHDNGRPTPIHYMRTGETSFMLQYELWATDDWIYDSTKPEAGWVQHWY